MRVEIKLKKTKHSFNTFYDILIFQPIKPISYWYNYIHRLICSTLLSLTKKYPLIFTTSNEIVYRR